MDPALEPHPKISYPFEASTHRIQPLIHTVPLSSPSPAMVFLKQFNCSPRLPLLLKPPAPVERSAICHQAKLSNRGRLVAKCCSQEEQKSKRGGFLSLEEAGLVEISGLSTHERFLCRLTISSLNLLRVISEQEGVAIEELNAGRICDWFMKDRLKREQNLGSAVLQWDDSEFQF